jgi:ATP-dependent Clp protease ATP-binding subunit ClpA
MSLFRRKPEYQITDRAVMRILDVARDAVLYRRVRVIDPRYLLLGLLDSDDPLLGDVLRGAGLDVPRARARLEAVLPAVVGPPDARAADRVLPYSGDSTRALELAAEEAVALDDASGPGPVHLLIALLRQGGEAAAVLSGAGLTLDAAYEHLGFLRQESAG